MTPSPARTGGKRFTPGQLMLLRRLKEGPLPVGKEAAAMCSGLCSLVRLKFAQKAQERKAHYAVFRITKAGRLALEGKEDE